MRIKLGGSARCVAAGGGHVAVALGEPLGDAADRSLARQVAPLLHVHCMACALHVHCTACALHVRCAYAARALRVRSTSMCAARALQVGVLLPSSQAEVAEAVAQAAGGGVSGLASLLQQTLPADADPSLVLVQLQQASPAPLPPTPRAGTRDPARAQVL